MKRRGLPTKTARKVVRKPRFDTVNAPISEMPQRAAKARRRKTPRDFDKIDPFHIDEKLIPAGWAYQWSVYVDPRTGWRPVPYSRHAHDFPKEAQSDGGFIVIKGLSLAEIPVEHVKAELAMATQKARALLGDFDRHLGRDYPGKGFFIMSPQFIVEREITAEMAHTEGPPVEVVVRLTMRVPQRWSAAAATLDLSLEEYTRRRILMERPVLGSVDPFSTETVYETVALHFSPTKEA